jgi:glucosamine--fructose-6-phosphate aminotransferase (isomerizing)
MFAVCALQGERYRIRLGGLVETRDIIRRSRRIMFVACGTSYHAALAARQTVSRWLEWYGVRIASQS